MKVDDNEFFMGLCFILSSQSKDKVKQSCIVTLGKKIISSGFSSIDMLGNIEGLSEKFAFSSLQANSSPFNVYIDHTPSQFALNYLCNFTVKKIVYFHTIDIVLTPSSSFHSKILKFNGNLNWLRDCIYNMERSDIFI